MTRLPSILATLGYALFAVLCAAQALGPAKDPAPVDPAPAVQAVNQLAASANASINAANAKAQQQAAQVAQLQQQLAAAQANAVTTAAATPSPITRSLGINLQALNYYGRGLVFGDAMLQAQPYWQGADAAGNPAVDQAPLVFTNAPPSWAGTYKLVCNGQPTLGFQASFGTVANQVYDPATDTTTADVTITADQLAAVNQLCIKFGNVQAGKVRNVQLWRPGATIGQRFYPPFLKLLAPFDFVRGMDFLGTTNSTQANWADRPLPTDRNFTSKGASYEDFYALCAAAGNKIPWACLPDQATDDYFAGWVALTKSLNVPAVYVEFSNETWNWGFDQCRRTFNNAQIDKSLQYGQYDGNILHYRYCAKRLQSLSAIVCKAYGVSDIRQTPIRPILAGQWANPDVLKYGLEYLSHAGPINQQIYGIAIAPYAVLPDPVLARINANDATLTATDVLAGYRTASQNGSTADPYTVAFVAQARAAGVHAMSYEIGEDCGQSPNCLPQKFAASRDPSNRAICANYVINQWQAGIEGVGFFLSTYGPDQWGTWGLSEDTLDLSGPKYAGVAGVGTLRSN